MWAEASDKLRLVQRANQISYTLRLRRRRRLRASERASERKGAEIESQVN